MVEEACDDVAKGWKLMDKGDSIFVGGLLSKSHVDVARDEKIFVVVVGLNEEGVAMDCLYGFNKDKRYGYFVYEGGLSFQRGE